MFYGKFGSNLISYIIIRAMEPRKLFPWAASRWSFREEKTGEENPFRLN
jgi:hypothetical protein